MSSTWSVRSDLEPIFHGMSRDVNKFVPRAIVLGLNKTGMKVRTTMIKEIMGQSSAKAGTVRGTKTSSRGIDIHKASTRTFTATIRVYERRGAPNLYGFQGVRKGRKMINGKARLGSGVRATVFGKSHTYKGTFVAPAPVTGNPKLVWIRTGREKIVPKQGKYAGKRIKRGPRKGQYIKREPLRPVWGPALPRFADTQATQAEIGRRVASEFVPEFARALQHVIRQAGKRYEKRMSKS